MSRNIPKIHLIVDESRARCGKLIVWNTEYTGEIKDVTCKSCKEAHAYENGKIREYRLGGNFDATGKERKFSGWAGYKEEWFKEKQRADDLEKQLKELRVDPCPDCQCSELLCGFPKHCTSEV